jgi:tRNA nucleotidyltransferase (CCA-adding enzyme)
MKFNLPINESIKNELLRLFQGHEIRLVGGCVRDIVFNHINNTDVIPKDIDLATTATPDEMLEIGRKFLVPVIPTGIAHGTCSFVINDTLYEITTLRIDRETNGRHAEVEFTTDWEIDSSRRDFSINSMSMDLVTGELFDYFDGFRDLCDARVRFVGNAEDRIREDYLRILRYVRFYGRFGAHHDEDAMIAMILLADGLKNISGERIWMELAKILSHESAPRVMRGMHKVILPYLGPSLRYTATIFDPVHTLTRNPVTLLAAMCDTVGHVDQVNDRFHLSADEHRLLRYLVERQNVTPTLAYVKDMCTSKNVGPTYAMEFCAMHRDLHTYNYVKNWTIPVFPVTGKVLLEQGIAPGPQMGVVLTRLERAWKDSDYALSLKDLLSLV